MSNEKIFHIFNIVVAYGCRSFRSEKFVLLVDDDLLNPAIFIFIKIFLMSAGKSNQNDDWRHILLTSLRGHTSSSLEEPDNGRFLRWLCVGSRRRGPQVSSNTSATLHSFAQSINFKSERFNRCFIDFWTWTLNKSLEQTWFTLRKPGDTTLIGWLLLVFYYSSRLYLKLFYCMDLFGRKFDLNTREYVAVRTRDRSNDGIADSLNIDTHFWYTRLH